MPTRQQPVCTHERGPGTTICLRCRHDALITATRRRRRLAVQAIACGIVLIVVAFAGFSGLKAVGRRGGGKPAASAVLPPDSQTAAIPDTTPPTLAPPVASPVSTPTTSPTPVTAVAPSSAPAPLTPHIPQGRTEFDDSVYAERTGDTVEVHFDYSMTHTRRPPKFEGILRNTLIAVYGEPARTALAAIPEGFAGDSAALVDNLPVNGLRVPIGSGWAIAVYPETRPTPYGPLVVAYRAVVRR